MQHDQNGAEQNAEDSILALTDAHDDALRRQDPQAPDESEEDSESRPRFRLARALLALLVVVALLTYFTVPFGNISFTGVYLRLRPPAGIRPIPLSPPHKERNQVSRLGDRSDGRTTPSTVRLCWEQDTLWAARLA